MLKVIQGTDQGLGPIAEGGGSFVNRDSCVSEMPVSKPRCIITGIGLTAAAFGVLWITPFPRFLVMGFLPTLFVVPLLVGGLGLGLGLYMTKGPGLDRRSMVLVSPGMYVGIVTSAVVAMNFSPETRSALEDPARFVGAVLWFLFHIAALTSISLLAMYLGRALGSAIKRR